MMLASLVLAVFAGGASLSAKETPYQVKIDPANFQDKVDNQWFPLVPGTVMKYTEKSKGVTTDITVTVTSETKMIMGVKCVVVHDTASEKGVLKEDTWDWYAQDKQGTVWYMGEATKEFLPGGATSTEGSWEAGVDNAQPGIIITADPKPGKPYRQEYLKNHAEDMGQVIALNETVKVAAGTYTGCVRTKEWSMIEAGSEKKWYAKGVGMVKAEALGGDVEELISVTKP